MFPIIPFTNSTTGNPGNNNIMNYLPVLLIAFVLFRMIRRGMTGSVYSRSRILRRPAIYIVLTVILGIFLYSNIYYILMAAVAFVPGLLFGDKFGRLSNVYNKGSTLMYRSNIVVVAIWGASFMARIVIQLLYPTSLEGIFITEVLLSFTSGILFGEAYHIMNKAKEMGVTESPAESQSVNP